MNKQTKIIGALLGAALAAASGVAVAESTYGYSAAGTAAVAANANVKLKVTVPKLILLRVGSAALPVDEIAWTSTTSWTTNPSTVVDGNNQQADWDGALPSFSFTPTGNALAVYAWHNNGTAGAELTFTGTAFSPTGGPTLAAITVAGTGGAVPAHPGGNLGTATTTPLTSNYLYSGTWTYTLGGTPTSWVAGSYSGAVLYTATTL